MIITIMICILIFSVFILWACCVCGKKADEVMEKIHREHSEIEG